ncbi:hypothetical protein HCN51_20500 [Nonomuraea sp. FMUSA5-5]|uniref:Uncharacterized protein n=1 Tax=Nonomuraea composti TaxID=2720023 RepID=A0ABX1B376_9ACTN|nr:hypothetical protein [Nonomuraea sp. FMUSA5-5]NJP91811.1 hypothetical protein [Nonomuraea sp. FMUSA5-5]
MTDVMSRMASRGRLEARRVLPSTTWLIAASARFPVVMPSSARTVPA